MPRQRRGLHFRELVSPLGYGLPTNKLVLSREMIPEGSYRLIAKVSFSTGLQPSSSQGLYALGHSKSQESWKVIPPSRYLTEARPHLLNVPLRGTRR